MKRYQFKSCSDFCRKSARLGVWVLALLVTTNSHAIQGSLKVEDSLRIVRTDGFKARLYTGTYRTEIMPSSEGWWIRVDKNGANIDIPVKINGDKGIPRNGEINLPASRTGQTFDIRGEAKTTRHQTESQREWEPCSYCRDEWVCRGRGRHRYCDWETICYNGFRDVEFYFLTTETTVNMNLQSAGNQPSKFTGQESDRRKIYTYQGQCE